MTRIAAQGVGGMVVACHDRMPTTPPRARLGLLHEVPPALRQLLKESGFEWAAWSASWRNAVSGTEIPFAEVREHLDEAWLRQRITEALARAKNA